MKRIAMGILAHVDAGKTTLTEALLYMTGQIRSQGRVDHGDTHLDTDAIERDRGITIFSKQARIHTDELDLTLLDTPGHVDFSAETERTMQILDCAVLVISGTDGVQSHTRTLWRLLGHYGVPVFLFVNKMDLAGADRARVMAELKKELSAECVDFGEPDDVRMEEIALSGEELLDELMENGTICDDSIAKAAAARRLFPVWFGSALRMENLEPLLEGLARYARPKYGEDKGETASRCKAVASEDDKAGTKESGNAGADGRSAKEGRAAEAAFAARVYKIGRDVQGKRLTYLRVTAGILSARMQVDYRAADGTEYTEKVDQIRLYTGEKYEQAAEVPAGTVCAVTGLTMTAAGIGLGAEMSVTTPVLEPAITRSLLLPPDTNPVDFYRKLKPLEEEEPTLHILWNENRRVIDVQIMGEVQIEVLTRLIRERFGAAVSFGEARVIYKETVARAVEGVGHFEPLRHYAEVHLLIEPGGVGSGVTVRSVVSTDALDLNWQRLILTHVLEREHPGVLVGGALTDVRVTLVAGRAHLKHTEGGDFRQATYRAIRQGLMTAECALLEPVYAFTLTIPAEAVGRAMSDLAGMAADYAEPIFEGDGSTVRIEGTVPVSTSGSYMAEVSAYTKGEGHLALSLFGYRPCHNAEEVMEASHYDPDADTENPAASVFCSHGAGFLVPWDQVSAYMHLPYATTFRGQAGDCEADENGNEADIEFSASFRSKAAAPREESGEGVISLEEDRELQGIYAREFGMDRQGMRMDAERNRRRSYAKRESGARYDSKTKLDKHGQPIYPAKDQREEHLIVDGYNIIFEWDDLRELARANIDAARGKLLDILSNYQGYMGYPVTVVFDAYRTNRNPDSVSQWQNLTVVFTRENVTADAYIERKVHDENGKYRFTVATSDGMEQLTVMRLGALRMSARMLAEEIARAGKM